MGNNHPTRREAVTTAAVAVATAAAPRAFAQAAASPARPFRIAVPQAKLDSIRQQVALSSIPVPLPGGVDAGSHGLTPGWLADLRSRWLDGYNWRAAETEFNRFPHYTADVDGQVLHLYHVPGRGPSPTPVLIGHGWPYSNLTFVPFLERLTDPAKFGGDPAKALTVIVPALPGYAFSPAPSVMTGPKRTAELYRKLMVEVLGYRRYGLQGGDQGCVVMPYLAAQYPDDVIGLHLNLVPTLPLPEAKQSADEKAWLAKGAAFMAAEMDYFRAQMDKPLMVGATLAASPMATAAWIAEKFWSWTDHDGDLDRVIPKDRLLTEVMAYVATDSIASSLWFYRTFQTEPFSLGVRIGAPTGVYLPAREFPIGNPPHDAIARSYNLVRETRPRHGMHFPFLEQPKAFAADISDFFAGLRT